MSSTRNLGIAAAKGDVVAFLDADDVWEEDHLDHEINLLLAILKPAMVCGQAIDWYSWRDPGVPDVVWLPPWPPGVVVPPPQMLTALLRRGSFRTPTCNLLVRKEVLDAIGGAEDQFHDMYEDQVLLAKLYLGHIAA